jgi:hypothetical protein
VSQLVDAALSYARRGWPVFPVHGVYWGHCTCGRRECSSPGKHPLVRRGVLDASNDARVIREWWRRWRLANVAIATGNASGIVVIDMDLPVAFDSLDVLRDKVPRTLTALTGGGGLHLVLRAPEVHSLHNHVGRLPGVAGDLPGIDLRADGGYVIAPPSSHASGHSYEWLDSTAPIAEAPAWMRERAPTRATHGAAPATFIGAGSAYGLAVLRDELDRLRRAQVGSRNHQLNRSAFAIAQIVAGGELAEAAARAALLDVASYIGLAEAESRQTLESAFAAGRGSPRSAPHRVGDWKSSR